MMFTIRRLGFVLGAAALAATCAHGQSREALDVQSARNKHVLGRAKRVFYTQQFNLDGLPEYRSEKEVAGTIRFWGSNYFGDGNLADYWEEGFRKYHPNVKFSNNFPTPLIGMSGLCTGLADIAANHHLSFDQQLEFERIFNYDPLELTVVTGSYNVPGWSPAYGVFVNKNNPISKLTMKQVDGIFGAQRTGAWQGTTWHPEVARSASGNIRTWGQLGLTGEWKDKPIHVYGDPMYRVGGRLQWLLIKGSDKWNEDTREYANFAKADGTLSIGAERLHEDLGKDLYGISYGTISYVTPQTKSVALADNEGGPYFELTIESVQNRTWPMYDEVYFYLNRAPGQPMDPKLKEFLRYVFSREGQEAVERDGKYLPLTADVVREQLKKLE